MKCSNCGADLDPSKTFCLKCGEDYDPNQPNNQVQNEQPSNQPINSANVNQKILSKKAGNDSYQNDKLVDVWIGSKASYFRNTSFNICALFFGPVYLFYRKMYLLGFVSLLISSFWPFSNLFIAFIFNAQYLKHVNSKVEEIKSKKKNEIDNENDLVEIIKKQGGTSILVVVGIIIIIILLFLLAIIEGLRTLPG